MGKRKEVSDAAMILVRRGNQSIRQARRTANWKEGIKVSQENR